MNKPDTTDATYGPQLSWDEKATKVTVASEQELMDRLERIAAEADEAPPLVQLSMPDGSSLAIGVGREQSVVTYIRSLNEPDYLSRGTAEASQPPVFYYHGADSEFPPDAAVPAGDACEAMRRFYRTGKRPDNIDWQH
jgi:immunity protein Imm1 of predicted polymorphic toxin system